MRAILQLGDDRKSAMALSYAVASWLVHMRRTTGHSMSFGAAFFFDNVMNTISEGTLTVPLEKLRQ